MAHLTAAAGLRLEQARWVDAAVVDGYETLSWTRFLERVEAKIIEVDPAGRGGTPQGGGVGPVRAHRAVQRVRPEDPGRQGPGR